MPNDSILDSTDIEQLRAEIKRQRKIIDSLMNRAEQGIAGNTDYNLFQAEIMLREQVRLRTEELENALIENSKINLELSKSEGRLQQLVQQSLVGICTTDGKRFLYTNPKFVELSGYSLTELQNIGPLDITVENERSAFDLYMKHGLAGELKGETFLINMLRKDGSEIITDVTLGSPIEINANPTLVAVFVDITDRICAEIKIKALNKRLQDEALHDHLTGLYNRRYLEELIQRELSRIRRNNKTISVVMGDLDYFKNVNDTYGHQAGDKAIQFVGELIIRNTRRSDICCRYGGEEFLLILPDISYEDALVRTEKLRLKLMASPINLGGTTIHLTGSFGVAAFPEDADDLDSLIAVADRALYRAKETGRNRVCSARDIDIGTSSI